MNPREMRPVRTILKATSALGLAGAMAIGAAAPLEMNAIEFEEAIIRFEVNATDEDAGIQVFVDGEPWDRLRVNSPDGRRILDVRGKGSLQGFGLAEMFFESNEPNFGDLSLEEILALFPEGTYEFTGRTAEGQRIVGEAELTHNLPAGPEIIMPLEDEIVDHENVVVMWDAVTDPPGIEIVNYEVIVEGEDDESQLLMTVPATVTSVSIPSEFLVPGAEYGLEVLAIEVSGNQTITESTFFTAE